MHPVYTSVVGEQIMDLPGSTTEVIYIPPHMRSKGLRPGCDATAAALDHWQVHCHARAHHRNAVVSTRVLREKLKAPSDFDRVDRTVPCSGRTCLGPPQALRFLSVLKGRASGAVRVQKSVKLCI